MPKTQTYTLKDASGVVIGTALVTTIGTPRGKSPEYKIDISPAQGSMKQKDIIGSIETGSMGYVVTIDEENTAVIKKLIAPENDDEARRIASAIGKVMIQNKEKPKSEQFNNAVDALKKISPQLVQLREREKEREKKDENPIIRSSTPNVARPVTQRAIDLKSLGIGFGAGVASTVAGGLLGSALLRDSGGNKGDRPPEKPPMVAEFDPSKGKKAATRPPEQVIPPVEVEEVKPPKVKANPPPQEEEIPQPKVAPKTMPKEEEIQPPKVEPKPGFAEKVKNPDKKSSLIVGTPEQEAIKLAKELPPLVQNVVKKSGINKDVLREGNSNQWSQLLDHLKKVNSLTPDDLRTAFLEALGAFMIAESEQALTDGAGMRLGTDYEMNGGEITTSKRPGFTAGISEQQDKILKYLKANQEARGVALPEEFKRKPGEAPKKYVERLFEALPANFDDAKSHFTQGNIRMSAVLLVLRLQGYMAQGGNDPLVEAVALAAANTLHHDAIQRSPARQAEGKKGSVKG